MCKVWNFFNYERILIIKVYTISLYQSNWMEMLLMCVDIMNSVIYLKFGYILYPIWLEKLIN